MNKITKTQLESFPIELGGRRVCPSGDYRNMRSFSWPHRFGRSSEFRARTKFTRCFFEEKCRFGRFCEFIDCTFAAGCSFNEDCTYGYSLCFSPNCTFNGHEAAKGHPLFICDGQFQRRRTLYFFNTVDGVFVQAGCFFGSVSEFLERTEKDCASSTGFMAPNTRKKKLAYPTLAQLAQTLFAIDHHIKT